jgi:hypothetical protein
MQGNMFIHIKPIKQFFPYIITLLLPFYFYIRAQRSVMFEYLSTYLLVLKWLQRTKKQELYLGCMNAYMSYFF